MAEFRYDLPETSGIDTLEVHYLEGMQLSRHHIFSHYNKYGNFYAAGKIADSRFVDGDIDISHNIGLSAELQFYHQFKARFNLVPSLDCGDNTDFVGEIKGHLVRFDVTTNLGYKHDDWEKYTKYKYHLIVLWDEKDNKWSCFVADKTSRGKFKKVK